MYYSQIQMWRALLAAFFLLPIPSLAEVVAQYDESEEVVVVSGLSQHSIAKVFEKPDHVRLGLKNSQSERGMAVELKEIAGDIVISPRFALKPGAVYDLALADKTLRILIPKPEANVPYLTSFSPSQSVLPANTLRVYLHFSEPMASGQLREMVSLIDDIGNIVPDPFLSLDAELWTHDQTRATLLFDPGRIKQGVGPNVERGAALKEGKIYRLMISPNMRSAKGVQLGQPTSVTFRIGAPERRAISPETWEVLTPEVDSHTPLSIAFDRIMDRATALRLISLIDPNGHRVHGQTVSDGGGWSLTPNRPWQTGQYSLIVDPELEDVAGNTIAAPFDAAPGTIGIQTEPIVLSVNLTKK